MPAYHEVTIAIPPPTGTGFECKLLALGMLTILFFSAKKINTYVKAKEEIPRMAMRIKLFKVRCIKV
jgi:hypothetical protein